MNQPSPALVAQAGVRRLPRWGLLTFCAIYLLAGFVGREPWRNYDVLSLGWMMDIANGRSSWFSAGEFVHGAEHFDALLPYWLGAAAIQFTAGWLEPFAAVRTVSMGMLAITLAAVWYAIYYLARSPQAQPVSFAFGGEANPKDYARTLADGGLLAFMACLGLAESAHNISPNLAQLCAMSLVFYALAALPYRLWGPATAGVIGMVGLTLSGAPVVALTVGMIGIAAYASRAQDWQGLQEQQPHYAPDPEQERQHQRKRWLWIMAITTLTLLCVVLASVLGLWHNRLAIPSRWVAWRDLIKLHLWFTWPVWPFVVWTLWRWRAYWRRGSPNRHLALPLALALFCATGGWISNRPTTMLLLCLPACSALAAFALPTFKRSVGAFIDWFTLIFFTLVAGYLWFMWSAVQLGGPASAVRQVVKRAGTYEIPFDIVGFMAALAVTLGWMALVRWRTKRLQPAIWKSMILPAGGVLLCWVLATTLWLPSLNHLRGYGLLAQSVQQTLPSGALPAGSCFQTIGLDDQQQAGLQYHLHIDLVDAPTRLDCHGMLVSANALAQARQSGALDNYQELGIARRNLGHKEVLHVFQRR